MQRPKLPKAPKGVKIDPNSLRGMVWYRKKKYTEKYITPTSISLIIDCFWSPSVSIYAHDWRDCGKKGITINYGSGGSRESDNFDYIYNFSNALLYAIELAEWYDLYLTYVQHKVDSDCQ